MFRKKELDRCYSAQRIEYEKDCLPDFFMKTVHPIHPYSYDLTMSA